jgi:signal transduction histidine kinase
VEEKTHEVRSLQEYNERILDSVPNPIIMLDEERVQYANRATNEAFHLNSERARGAKLFDLIAMDAASCEQLRGSLRAYAKGWEGATDATDRMTTAAGSWPLPADPLSPQQLVESEHARRELTIDRQTYRYELFHIGGQSAGKRWIGLMLRDATGESRLQDELIQAEKLAGLGVLTTGIGHELNNPLFGILSLGEAIRDEKDAVRMKEHAKEIVGHAKRMAGIIQDFAGSARSDGSDLRDDVDVNAQLDLALRVVGLTDAVAGLQVRRHYRPVPKIRAVPEEIGQAFVSLITNAIQAMKGKGTIDLITELSQDTIVVRVRDSGPGIPKAYVSKIFDPFFTTKAPGQGTGLGLTMTRRIVLKHGGYIHVETAEGRGATFVLIFPASDTAAE